MIRINLLPPEKRRAERPPAGRLVLLAVAGAVAGVFILVNFFGWLRLQGIDGEIETMEGEIRSLRGVVEEYDAHEARKKQLEGRVKDVEAAIGRPFAWYEVLDGLWTVLDEFQRTSGGWVVSIKTVEGQQVAGAWRQVDPAARSGPQYMIDIEVRMFGGYNTGPESLGWLQRRLVEVMGTRFPHVVRVAWNKSENAEMREGEEPYIYSSKLQLFSPPAAGGGRSPGGGS